MKQFSKTWTVRDGKVFQFDTALRGVKAEQFEILNELYGKDDHHVYFLSGKIKDVDPASFVACDSGRYCDHHGFTPWSYQGYGKDLTFVWHHVMTIGKPSKLKRADPKTFLSINGIFGTDASRVYYEHKMIQKADRSTWSPLLGLYSADANRVFYGNHAIDGADPQSFIMLWGRGNLWAADKHNFYQGGRNRTKEEYFQEYDSLIETVVKRKDTIIETLPPRK